MTTWDDKPNDYEHAVKVIESLREVTELAKQVRAAQKKYFKTRDRNDLVASKQLERRLDDALANE